MSDEIKAALDEMPDVLDGLRGTSVFWVYRAEAFEQECVALRAENERLRQVFESLQQRCEDWHRAHIEGTYVEEKTPELWDIVEEAWEEALDDE